MFHRYPYLSARIALTLAILLGTCHWSTQRTLGITLRIISNDFVEKNSGFNVPAWQNLGSSDLLSYLVQTEQPIAELLPNEATTTQQASSPSSLSFDSIVSSLRQLDLSLDSGNETINEVPIVPQADPSEVYKDIYDFGQTSAEELSEPISFGLLPPTTSEGTENLVGTSNLGLAGSPLEIGSPRLNYAGPLAQTGRPSVRGFNSGHWGDSNVDIFFATLPKTEVVDMDTFMRTVYISTPSDMVEEIDKSLDTTVDTQFQLMPNDIFPANRLPSESWKRNL